MSIYVVLDISNRYFVQSKADSLSHWYLHIRGACLVCGDANCNAIHMSSKHHTKFCVQVHPGDNSQAQKDLVMIDKDKISITACKDYTVHISDTEDLKATTGYQGKTDLLFGDLKDRFISHCWNDRYFLSYLIFRSNHFSYQSYVIHICHGSHDIHFTDWWALLMFCYWMISLSPYLYDKSFYCYWL